MKILSSERRQRAMPIALARAARTVPVQVVTIDPARAAITDQAAVASTDLVVAPKCKTWIVRPRIDSVADKRANASKTFNAEVAIDLEEEDLAAAVSGVAADSGVDDEN